MNASRPRPTLRVGAFALALCLAPMGLMGVPGAARSEGAPYDERLLRLAEVLGALHYLRNLCGERSSTWRGDMQRLLDAEEPDTERRARLIASFNRGYEGYRANYSSCTDSATEAVARYMREGEKLAREIVVRYGN